MVFTMLAYLRPSNFVGWTKYFLGLFTHTLILVYNTKSVAIEMATLEMIRHDLNDFLSQILGRIKINLLKWLLLILLLISDQSFADFSINTAKTRIADKIYLLDAQISYKLTDKAIDALNNGITLPIVLTIKIKRARWYFWNESVAELEQRYQLKYYTLSQQYSIKHLNTGIVQMFPTLDIALAYLGSLTDFPLLDAHLVKSSGEYWVYLQTYLDIESLPVPLRPVAYFTAQWRLTSDWYQCSLTK